MFLETYKPFFWDVFLSNLPGAKNLSDFFFVKICQNDRTFSFPPPGLWKGIFNISTNGGVMLPDYQGR